MKYLIPAILAFLVGIILWLIKRKRQAADYEIIESESFPRENGLGKYFVIKIRNSGNTPIKDADLDINFDFGMIESINFSDKRLVSNVSKDNSSIKSVIPLLNPRETLSITITIFADKSITTPDVNVRAVGVTAVPKQVEYFSTYGTSIIAGIAIVVTLTMLFSVWSSYRQSRLIKTVEKISDVEAIPDKIEKARLSLEKALEIESEAQKKANDEKKSLEQKKREYEIYKEQVRQGKPEGEQIIFGILNRAGLGHLMPKLILSGEHICYWKTGLFLMHSFLLDQKNGDKYVFALEQLIEVENVAPSSHGFIIYLLGKMEHYRGNSEKAIKLFNRCKHDTPLMYEHLMAQDPAYDLDAIKKYLMRELK